MKAIKFIITAALAMLAFNASAQYIPRTTFSVGGNNFTVSSNLTYAIVPSDGVGRPRVTFVSATSDQAASQTGAGTAVSGGVLKLYSIQEWTPCTLATTAATTNQIQVANATNFTSNTVCILRVATNFMGNSFYSYQRLVANTNTQVTNVTFSSSTGGSVAVGDMLYRCRLESTIPLAPPSSGAPQPTTISTEQNSPIWTGREGQPLLLEVAGNGTNVINIAVSGTYSP